MILVAQVANDEVPATDCECEEYNEFFANQLSHDSHCHRLKEFISLEGSCHESSIPVKGKRLADKVKSENTTIASCGII